LQHNCIIFPNKKQRRALLKRLPASQLFTVVGKLLLRQILSTVQLPDLFSQIVFHNRTPFILISSKLNFDYTAPYPQKRESFALKADCKNHRFPIEKRWFRNVG